MILILRKSLQNFKVITNNWCLIQKELLEWTTCAKKTVRNFFDVTKEALVKNHTSWTLVVRTYPTFQSQRGKNPQKQG